MPRTTTATADPSTRDGYAEMVSAFDRARTAAAEGNHGEVLVALAAVADGAAGHDLAAWSDVLATPFGDKRMPDPTNLTVGNFAHFLSTEDDGAGAPYDWEFETLEGLIRAAIEACGPADWYREELYALWGEEPERTPEQRIKRLEKQVQALAEDYAEQVYEHRGPVEWQDEEGWLKIVAAGKVAGAVDA
jgi:hypothetical protein